ncbi:MAG: 5-formyltetrahydrofolate cyclo-ligase [Euzebya sp.]
MAQTPTCGGHDHLPNTPTTRSAEKAALRAGALRDRSELPTIYRQQADAAIVASVADLIDALGNVRCVGLYAAIGQEVDVDALSAPLSRRGLEVAYPRIQDVSTMTFHRCDEPPNTARGRPPIREPDANAPLVKPDVIVVPALAFDPTGRRLGYGRGYYDRYLAPGVQVITIGVCHGRMLMAEVPTMPHDVGVDAVVTENAVYR